MSPAQNRVTPLGDLRAIRLRGAWTGNRGRLHTGHEITRFHTGNLWIVCALEFHGRRNEQWRPNSFTWVYFYDEAVAFSAGHRPCGECRWSSYTAYRRAWSETQGVGEPSAAEMNRQLHGERIHRGTHRRRLHALPWRELPDGAFTLFEGTPHLVVGDVLREWTELGYGTRRSRPAQGDAVVITPLTTVAILRAGYQVQIDSSAR